MTDSTQWRLLHFRRRISLMDGPIEVDIDSDMRLLAEAADGLDERDRLRLLVCSARSMLEILREYAPDAKAQDLVSQVLEKIRAEFSRP